MKKILTIKELVDFAYMRYKTKGAVTIRKDFIKDINYFDYRFDIYSMARAIKSEIKERKIAILAENRYEFNVIYLANSILNNQIFIIDYFLSEKEIEKIINKNNIRVIFFSNKTKNKLLNINEKVKNKFKLINFDSNNKFPIMEYEKMMNLGRYIENYSIENIENVENVFLNCVVANKNEIKKYNENEILGLSKEIIRKLKIKKKRYIGVEENLNSIYLIIFNIIIPLMCGLNEVFYDNYIKIKNNIEIVEDGKNIIEIRYNKKGYVINKENSKIIKKEYSKNYRTPKLVLIKSNKNSTNKQTIKKVLIN